MNKTLAISIKKLLAAYKRTQDEDILEVVEVLLELICDTPEITTGTVSTDKLIFTDSYSEGVPRRYVSPNFTDLSTAVVMYAVHTEQTVPTLESTFTFSEAGDSVDIVTSSAYVGSDCTSTSIRIKTDELD